MKASAENVFVGANLTKDNENYLVVKVNAKSMYVAKGWTLEQYNKALAMKQKGITFKDFCEKSGIETAKYNGYDIAEEESAKKAVVEETKKTTVSALGKAEKVVLTDLLKYNKLRRFQNIQVGEKTMRMLESKDDDKFLLNIDNKYILYNKSLDASYPVCSVFEWGKKATEIPWEKITPKAVT